MNILNALTIDKAIQYFKMKKYKNIFSLKQKPLKKEKGKQSLLRRNSK